MKDYTIEKIRNLIREKIGWKNNLDDDNDIYIQFGPDEDCPYDIVAYVMLRDGDRLRVDVSPVGYRVPSNQRAKIMVTMNELNIQYNYITGHITDDGRIVFVHNTSLDQDVSDDFVAINAIRRPISGAFQYIAEVLKL